MRAFVNSKRANASRLDAAPSFFSTAKRNNRMDRAIAIAAHDPHSCRISRAPKGGVFASHLTQAISPTSLSQKRLNSPSRIVEIVR
jgi:hypothetical protein